MADLGEIFDPAEVPEDSRGGFEPLPVGNYTCQVIDSSVVRTKAGDGEILKLTLEVMEGPYERRRIFENLNYHNPNPVAQSIAQSALAKLCNATGVGPTRESEDLHFKPFVAYVEIEHDKTGQYPPKNRVKNYKEANAAPPKGRVVSDPAVERPPVKGSRPWAVPNASGRSA